MAQGQSHFKIEATVGVGLLIALAIPATRAALPEWVDGGALLAFAAGYVFSLFWLSPDLDQPRNAARARWGPLKFIWWPYTKLFKHRGWSHSILIGTATRLVYLALVVGGPALLVALNAGWVEWSQVEWEIVVDWATRYPGPIIGFVVGCHIPDALHVLVDRMTL